MAIKCPECYFKNPNDTIYCGKCGTLIQPSKNIHISQTKTIQKISGELSIGSTLTDRYKIIEEIGRGGMGIVYKAEDTKLKRTVAMKFLPQERTVDPDAKERFVREAQAAAALDHPNICTVHEIDEIEGKTFIAMAYVDGKNLREKSKSGPLKLDEVLDIALQVAEGLEEAHKKGITHRDIKSSNIMVTPKGQAMIMDFGLAKVAGGTLITKEATTMGTVAYMSPEQTRGESVDHRTDIWSFGVILYEMLGGQLPFRGENETSVMYSIVHEEPKPLKALQPDIPEEMEQVVEKTLAKNPKERYQNIEDLLDDLYSISKGFVPPKIRAAIRKAKLTKRKRVYLYGGIAVLSVLIVVAGIYLFTMRGKLVDSVAVLPFEDLSPRKDQEYFCDGLADELINRLTNIESLRVPARTSAFSFKGKEVHIQEIGEKLNVDMILEGSIRKAGNKLRITVQLVNVADGYPLWSEKYERDEEDIFALQDEISLAIVDKLKIKLLRAEKAQLVKRHTENLEAYNLYLKGRYFWNKRTGEETKKGMEYFQQAIENDPTYALAYVGLADSFNILGSYGVFPPNVVYPKGKDMARKALEIDDTLGEAYASLGWFSTAYDWEWLAAEREFKRAIEINPNYASTHMWYAIYLGAMGRHDEAITEIKRAQELDPLSLIINTYVGYIFALARQYDEAIEQLRKTLEMDPNYLIAHLWLGDVYCQKGMWEEALVEIQKTMSIAGDMPFALHWIGHDYALLGQTDEALKALNRLNKLSKERYIPSLSKAWIYMGLGDRDQAFEHLEKAYLERDTTLIFVKEGHGFDKLRSDPRFRTLLEKIGFE